MAGMTCDACDGTGACGTCQSHGCADCDFSGACDACGGVERDEARTKARQTGKPHYVIIEDGNYRVVSADYYKSEWGGLGPTIVFGVWPHRSLWSSNHD